MPHINRMPRRHPTHHLMMAAALALAGCTAPGIPSPSFQLAPVGASLVVRVAPDGYTTQYLRVWDWDVAEATLAAPGQAPVSASAEAGPDETGKRRATLVFPGLSPGAGYTLTLTLMRKGTDDALEAVGTATQAGLVVGHGETTLEIGPSLVRQTPPMAAPKPLLPRFVTSLPAAGTPARLNEPQGVAVAPDGTLYIADTTNGCVRRVSTDAQGRLSVTMLAGTGYPGSGDGAANLARFNRPTGLAVGPDGAVYVADTGNRLIRKISTSADGLVTVATLRDTKNAGLAFDSPAGVAVDAQGRVYVAEKTRLTRLTPSATANQYTALTLAGTAEAALADGDGATARFKDLKAIAPGPAGTYYMADAGNQRVRVVSLSGDNAAVSTLATPYANLTGLAASGASTLYVAEATRVHTLTLGATPTSTPLLGGTGAGFANGTGTAARFDGISGLALTPQGALFIADKANHRVRKAEVGAGADAVVSTAVGDGNPGNMNGPAGEPTLMVRPTSMCQGPDGAIYVADLKGNRIVRITPTPEGGTGEILAGGAAAGKQDGPAATASFSGPAGIACGPDGAFYITDVDYGLIRRLSRDEEGQWRVATVASGFQYPGGIVVGADGALYLTESGNPTDSISFLGRHRVLKVVLSPTGGATTTVVAGGSSGAFAEGVGANARFHRPTSLAFGPDGALYVGDTKNSRIRRITLDAAGVGTVTTYAGDGTAAFKEGPRLQAQFNWVQGLAFDAQGRLFAADYWNHRLRMIDTDGQVSTYAGWGDAYSDGPLAQAAFSRPVGLCFGADGALFVVDAHPNAIRRITP